MWLLGNMTTSHKISQIIKVLQIWSRRYCDNAVRCSRWKNVQSKSFLPVAPSKVVARQHDDIKMCDRDIYMYPCTKLRWLCRRSLWTDRQREVWLNCGGSIRLKIWFFTCFVSFKILLKNSNWEIMNEYWLFFICKKNTWVSNWLKFLIILNVQ